MYQVFVKFLEDDHKAIAANQEVCVIIGVWF